MFLLQERSTFIFTLQRFLICICSMFTIAMARFLFQTFLTVSVWQYECLALTTLCGILCILTEPSSVFTLSILSSLWISRVSDHLPGTLQKKTNIYIYFTPSLVILLDAFCSDVDGSDIYADGMCCFRL